MANLGLKSAADLLRQTVSQSSNKSPATPADDEQRSACPTPPPQTSTPQPDPADKRLPGIFSSYFGQVRESLRPVAKHTSSTPSAAGAADMGNETPKPGDGEGELSTAPNARRSEDDLDSPPPLLAHERVGAVPQQESSAINHGYPTPPTSSSSSLRKSFQRASSARASRSDKDAAAAGAGDSPLSSERLSADFPPELQQLEGVKSPSPPSTTSSSSKPSISAPHSLNPGVRIAHSTPAAPVVSCTSASHAATVSPQRSNDLESLTEGATSSRNQNTPPRTPRTHSYNSEQNSRTASPHPTSNTSTTAQVASPPLHTSTSNAVLGEQKGKLTVAISEARGLKPSVDPYVVCQFQWNEYISKGPRNNGASPDAENGPETAVVTAMRRSDSDMGRSMAIPMKSRQSSQTSITTSREHKQTKQVTDPVWNYEAVFDVVGEQAELDISIYENSSQETFLGHVRLTPDLHEDGTPLDKWFRLEARDSTEAHVSGEIHLQVKFQSTEKKHYGPSDFQILKLIGKGTFGQVFQVRKRDTHRVYAMKVLSKKVIVQKKEVAHTLGERNILVRTAMTESPFIVGLKFSFQTPSDLFLVTDYMSGGELFWHLQKEGRFHEARAKFYIAELILALQHLHKHDIVYRDLKPENILLDANGHISLCDFGLSKANLTKDDTTNTFCGTTEYLAPEVLLDEQGYTKMVDFWSLGVLVFEMCCGWSPFYAEDTQQMYKNIAFGKVRFPRDALSTEGRNFVKGLLNRNPKHRLGATHDAEELKAHPFFADIDWDALAKKSLVPPFKPKLKSETDTSNFDPEFTNALANGQGSLNARAAAVASGITTASTPLSPTLQAKFKGFTFVDESAIEKQARADTNVGSDEEMDEADDGDEDDEEWGERSLTTTQSRNDRMSGVVRTGQEEGVFGGALEY